MFQMLSFVMHQLDLAPDTADEQELPISHMQLLPLCRAPGSGLTSASRCHLTTTMNP